LTNGGDGPNKDLDEAIRRLQAAGLISTQEVSERHLAATSTSTNGSTFVFDSSDGINGTLTFTGPARLSRLLLFFKWLFFIPLVLWLLVYRAAALVVAFLAFLAILINGRYPPGLFNFVRGYVASHYRVYSYFPLLLSDEWSAGQKNPLNFVMEPQAQQSRLLLVFVKLPMMVLGAFYGIASFGTWVLTLFAVPMWFAILFTGRYPRPARRFSLSVLQWSARVTAWQFFMSDDWALFGKTMKVRVPAVAAAIIFPAFVMWWTIAGPKTNFAYDFLGVTGAKDAVAEFMVAARDGDTDRAMALTDPETVSNAQLNALLQKRELFATYESLSVTGFFREKSTAFGDRMRLNGNVTYTSGPKGRYEVVLVKRRGEWRIQSILLQR
jgi:hypothetical protein